MTTVTPNRRSFPRNGMNKKKNVSREPVTPPHFSLEEKKEVDVSTPQKQEGNVIHEPMTPRRLFGSEEKKLDVSTPQKQEGHVTQEPMTPRRLFVADEETPYNSDLNLTPSFNEPIQQKPRFKRLEYWTQLLEQQGQLVVREGEFVIRVEYNICIYNPFRDSTRWIGKNLKYAFPTNADFSPRRRL